MRTDRALGQGASSAERIERPKRIDRKGREQFGCQAKSKVYRLALRNLTGFFEARLPEWGVLVRVNCSQGDKFVTPI